jgi:hypothetical protein
MSNIKSRFAEVMKMMGIVVVAAALAMAAFPTNSSAASLSVGGGNYGKAIISVYDASSPLAGVVPVAVAGASVQVANSAGAVILTGTTAGDGKVTLALPKGTYKVVVAAKGFESTSVEVAVNAGSAQDVAVGLHRVPSNISPIDR